MDHCALSLMRQADPDNYSCSKCKKRHGFHITVAFWSSKLGPGPFPSFAKSQYKTQLQKPSA